MLKRMFASKDMNEQNIEDLFKGICESCGIKNLKWDRMVGKPVKADTKTIYPIVEIVAIGNKMQNFQGIEISPIALVIEESGEKYALSLTGEEIDPGEFVEMVEESKK